MERETQGAGGSEAEPEPDRVASQGLPLVSEPHNEAGLIEGREPTAADLTGDTEAARSVHPARGVMRPMGDRKRMLGTDSTIKMDSTDMPGARWLIGGIAALAVLTAGGLWAVNSAAEKRTSDLRKELTDHMDRLEARMEARISKSVTDSEGRLSERMDRMEGRLSERMDRMEARLPDVMEAAVAKALEASRESEDREP